ncbi:retrotransposon protein, putative, ty1-copia subclass [Tanacetum coccineum]
MSPALQRQFELYFPQAMLNELRKMFEKPPAVEIYDLVDTLHSCKQAPGKSWLFNPKPKQNPPQKKENPKLDQSLSPCNVDVGSLGEGTASLPQKELAHKYEHDAEARVKRKLSYGEQYLHVGNGAQAAVEAIGVFNLVLPSGLVLSLNNCHYAPSIIRGVVSFSCLLDLGFVHTVTSNGISVSLNGIFYFSAISVNGVFEIDMNDNVSKNNNNSIFSINKKRKLDLNSSYLWHCRLAHIGKTRMQKLQREGLLESITIETH